jgi:hybrid cluster-associated redox disulfide protein
MTTFSKDMAILEALELHPQAREVFARHDMACCLCVGADVETIEAGAIMHGVDADTVVEALNRLPTQES